MSKKAGSALGETLRTIIYAVLIALGIRTFAYEPFNIPSSSMEPTLLVGDYLFVSKLSYGYSRHSLPFSPPLFNGRILGDQPQRGDVVVFKLPSDDTTDYIKRVIGLPGDRVQMIGGILHINGEAVKREVVPEAERTPVDEANSFVIEYRETLPNGVQHRIFELSDQGHLDNTVEYTVPPGHFFMMGDNRDNSLDSRANVGFVPFENLVGRAEIVFFSHNDEAHLWEVWKWPLAIRYGRLFDVID